MNDIEKEDDFDEFIEIMTAKTPDKDILEDLRIIFDFRFIYRR